jgi:hypothetical protein
MKQNSRVRLVCEDLQFDDLSFSKLRNVCPLYTIDPPLPSSLPGIMG